MTTAVNNGKVIHFPTATAPARVELKLDLACGQNLKPGFEGVDLYGDVAKYKQDLTKFPWQWEDGSVAELHCSHYVEHLPMIEVEHNGKIKDLLFAFFDECHRILAPGGTMTVAVPSCMSTRAFQDPTHRRFLAPATFLYLNNEWRKINKLDHYQVECHFNIDVRHGIDQAEGLRSAEVHNQRINTMWNVSLDLHAVLVKPDPNMIMATPTT